MADNHTFLLLGGNWNFSPSYLTSMLQFLKFLHCSHKNLFYHNFIFEYDLLIQCLWRGLLLFLIFREKNFPFFTSRKNFGILSQKYPVESTFLLKNFTLNWFDEKNWQQEKKEITHTVEIKAIYYHWIKIPLLSRNFCQKRVISTLCSNVTITAKFILSTYGKILLSPKKNRQIN